MRFLLRDSSNVNRCSNQIEKECSIIFLMMNLYENINYVKHFWTVWFIHQPCHSHFCCWLLPIWPKMDVWAENGAYGMCRLGWQYNEAKLSFSWTTMLLLMIWNTSELSPLHLRRVTAIFVVDCCQFDPSWISWAENEVWACADLAGGTMDKNCLFPELTCEIRWLEILLNCLHHTSAVSQPILLLMAANLTLAGCLGWNVAYSLCGLGWRYNGAKMSFSWSYMIL